jgi:hypothetical protein
MVVTMPMTVVHEDVHQRTGREKQERQKPSDMGPVFLKQEIGCHSPHDEKP